MRIYQFDLYLESEVDVPSFSLFNGEYLRKLYLLLLERQESALVSFLKRRGRLRPYTVRNLLPVVGGERYRPPYRSLSFPLRRSELYRASFVVTLKEVAYPSFNSFLQLDDQHVELTSARIPFVIRKMTFHEHTLSIQQFLSPPRKTFFVDLLFLTPTQFLRKKVEFPLVWPEPRLFFGNLLTHYNGITHEPPFTKFETDNFLSMVETHVYPIGYRIQTYRWKIRNKIPFIGFCGWIRWRISTRDFLEYLPWVLYLLKFGEYVNVGKQRAIGFGRYVIERMYGSRARKLS